VFDSSEEVAAATEELREAERLNRRLIRICAFRALTAARGHSSPEKERLSEFLTEFERENDRRFNSHLHSESEWSPLLVKERKPSYSATSEVVDGRVVLQRCFDHNLKKDARLFIVGEDVGKLGDVNLVFQGLNPKYGELRVTDTGIREATILGQGIGAALRGLRPIVDIQYLDYLAYALEVMSDDLATLYFRTAGGQKAPVIIRTKGHRFEGIWHSGSPMAMILHSCRGIYLAVPRDMTRAAGFYNTLVQGDSPGIVIEVLHGYRVKERVPDNVGTFTVPFGVPEILREGDDITVVTYGYCCTVALDAARTLSALGVEMELIDVQTLSPFDIHHRIVDSLAKTNAVLFLDEDVPGAASAFMMQQVLEEQGGWQFLDAAPRTLSAKPNRSPFGIDGGYFSKPNEQDIVELCYSIVRERRPADLPPLR
jgi:pyruvate/2-oxoglutarate/acetoin dehydrogenase E1 component